MEKPEVDNVEEEQSSVLEQPKIDEVGEDQDSVPSKKQKNDKYGASITSTTKNIENQGKLWLWKPTHLLSPQKIILTQNTKQRIHKHPQKQLIPPKIIKMTQLTRQINKSLFQNFFYYINVPK